MAIIHPHSKGAEERNDQCDEIALYKTAYLRSIIPS